MLRSFLFLTTVFLCTHALAQHPVGIFDNHIDIGNPKLAGAAGYDEASQTYTIAGAGSNIWFNRDEFHFLYKKLKGNFMLTDPDHPCRQVSRQTLSRRGLHGKRTGLCP